MSAPIFITVLSNGNIWVSQDVNWVKPASEAGTVLKHFRVHPLATPQKITTLTGSGNSSASALAASLGSTGRHGADVTLDSRDVT